MLLHLPRVRGVGSIKLKGDHHPDQFTWPLGRLAEQLFSGQATLQSDIIQNLEIFKIQRMRPKQSIPAWDSGSVATHVGVTGSLSLLNSRSSGSVSALRSLPPRDTLQAVIPGGADLRDGRSDSRCRSDGGGGSPVTPFCHYPLALQRIPESRRVS